MREFDADTKCYAFRWYPFQFFNAEPRSKFHIYIYCSFAAIAMNPIILFMISWHIHSFIHYNNKWMGERILWHSFRLIFDRVKFYFFLSKFYIIISIVIQVLNKIKIIEFAIEFWFDRKILEFLLWTMETLIKRVLKFRNKKCRIYTIEIISNRIIILQSYRTIFHSILIWIYILMRPITYSVQYNTVVVIWRWHIMSYKNK